MSSIICRDRAHKAPSGPEGALQGPGVSSFGYGPLSFLQGARPPQQKGIFYYYIIILPLF